LEERYGLIDQSFCHGSSGVAHLFRRMYLNTGIAAFKDAADYWISVLEQMIDHADKTGFNYFTREGWENRYDLLEGDLGANIVLASYYSNSDPDWDECFLLS